MTFSQAQSRGRLLRFLVDNLGQEIESGSPAASSYIAINSDSELVLTGITHDGSGPFTESDGSNAYTTSSINIGSTDTPTYTLDVDGTFRAQGGVILGDADSDITTVTSQLTASEGANIATGKYLEIGGVSAVSDSGNAIILGSTATDKTLSLQTDFGTALSIDASGFLTVPMGFTSALGTPITGIDRSAVNEWVKVAEFNEDDEDGANNYASAVIDVMLAGYDASAEIYQARVHLRAVGSNTVYSICQVDIIQDIGSEAWDTTDFILTQKTSSPYEGQLWVHSLPPHQQCYATITNGSSTGDSLYKTDWYLTPEQTWGSYTSLGSDITTTNVKKRFDSLVIDGDLTVNGQPLVSACRTSHQYFEETYTDWQTMVFNNDSTGPNFDVGGDYNTTSGIFTAPADGKYYVKAGALLYNVPNDSTIYLTPVFTQDNGKNLYRGYYVGAQYTYTESAGDDLPYFNIRGDWIIPMDSGDTLYIQARATEADSGTRFFGHSSNWYTHLYIAKIA